MIEGWYNSFKWLTSKKWITGDGLEDEFEKPFYEALMKYIGKDILKDLQKRAKRLVEGGANIKPVAPDLWLITKDGQFKFIESKLPGDTINRRQIAGMALIKKYVEIKSPVSVILISLYPKGSAKPEGRDYQVEFNQFIKMI
jgi:hypothetical protein